MGSILRSNFVYILVLALLVVMGSLLAPAAGLVLAAGASESTYAADGPGGEDRVTSPADLGDYVVYMPLIMRRWPPVAYSPDLSIAEDVVWDAPVLLDWQADVPLSEYPILAYVVEESTSPVFTTIVSHTVPTITVPYTTPVKPYGTSGQYHYRVRGDNVWGPGEWSNVAQGLLLSQRDGFDYPQSGWAPRRTSYWDLSAMAADYTGGELVTRVEDRFDFAIFSPMRAAPAPPYELRMHTRILHLANETSFGMVFGGNEGSFCGVERETSADPSGCFSHYYRLNVIWGGYLKASVARVDRHEGVLGGGNGVVGSGGDYFGFESWEADPHGWNEWKIRVYTDGFIVYVNGREIARSDDTSYLHDPHYGIYSSTYEYNGARFEHSYYFVEPLEGSSTMPTTLVPSARPPILATD